MSDTTRSQSYKTNPSSAMQPDVALEEPAQPCPSHPLEEAEAVGVARPARSRPGTL